MMRSLYAAVSGMRVHQTKMDVIGNNIANVNTVGFKASSVTFEEVFSQTVKGAGSPGDGRGGTNPQQIGLGVGMSSIAVNHGKGSTQRTDNATDLMIDGDGFFVVTNDANAQNRFYTRAGNFTVDEEGSLVNAQGYRVLDENFQPIKISKSVTKKASETNSLQLVGNLNSSEGDYTTTADVYDSLGDVHTLSVNFHGDSIGFKMNPDDLPNSADDPKYNDYNNPGTEAQDYSLKRVSITNENAINSHNGIGARDPSTPDDYAADDIYALFNEDGQVIDLVKLGGDPNDSATWNLTDPADANITGSATEKLELLIPGANDLEIDISRDIFFPDTDGDGVNDTDKSATFTQYSQETDVKAVELAGNSAGSINSFNISSKGEIIASFTNGEKETLATITLAGFDNPAGLEKVGGNLFTNTNNSGTPKYGTPSTGSFGSINPGSLEMSNVDLSKEFTEMITTQRGFQANSRVISTSDEILQELVNLKR